MPADLEYITAPPVGWALAACQLPPAARLVLLAVHWPPSRPLPEERGGEVHLVPNDYKHNVVREKKGQ